MCSEALYNLGNDSRSLSPEMVGKIVDIALADYCAVLGHCAEQLADTSDPFHGSCTVWKLEVVCVVPAFYKD